jgi:hypothetical protein
MDCMSSRMVLVARNAGATAAAGGGGGAWHAADKAATTSDAFRPDVRMSPH